MGSPEQGFQPHDGKPNKVEEAWERRVMAEVKRRTASELFFGALALVGTISSTSIEFFQKNALESGEFVGFTVLLISALVYHLEATEKEVREKWGITTPKDKK